MGFIGQNKFVEYIEYVIYISICSILIEEVGWGLMIRIAIFGNIYKQNV